MYDDDGDVGMSVKSKPAWLAPTVVIVLVLALVYAGRKKEEAVENPIVDLAVITIGVFAFAAVFRLIATRLGAPGLATFFGAPVQPHPDYAEVA
jgi:hypothetical protein